MTTAGRRYLIPAHGYNSEAVKAAFKLALLAHQKDSSLKRVLLLLPSKVSLTGPLENELGKNATRALSKGERLPLTEELSLYCETLKTFNEFDSPGIIIGLFAEKKMLDLMDAARDVAVRIVVPWTMDREIDAWRSTWNPEVPGEAPQPEKPIVENPVVAAAIRMLTGSINLDSGLTNPSDKGAAIEILRILKNAGEYFSPAALRAYAVKNGWKPEDADELKELADRINSRKGAAKVEYRHWQTDILGRLRQGENASHSDE